MRDNAEIRAKFAKTRAGKRILENRQPKLIENDKTTIFVRGANANNVVSTAMKNIALLKKPNCVLYNRKNQMNPMEDVTKLEDFCLKSNASLFMFGSHNKKRPNNLIAGRLFGGNVLDMFEFGIEEFKAMQDFEISKISKGNKPMLLFTEGFEETSDFQRLKNFFIDFFRGPVVEHINIKGFEHLLVFSLVNGKILFRNYRTELKKDSESKVPLVELTEIGPHMNLVMRRSKLASDQLFKASCKKPKKLKPPKVKNVSQDKLGTTLGRIHMDRQDYSKLNIKRMKGLKKRKIYSKGKIDSAIKNYPKGKIDSTIKNYPSSESAPKKIKTVPEEA